MVELRDIDFSCLWSRELLRVGDKLRLVNDGGIWGRGMWFYNGKECVEAEVVGCGDSKGEVRVRELNCRLCERRGGEEYSVSLTGFLKQHMQSLQKVPQDLRHADYEISSCTGPNKSPYDGLVARVRSSEARDLMDLKKDYKAAVESELEGAERQLDEGSTEEFDATEPESNERPPSRLTSFERLFRKVALATMHRAESDVETRESRRPSDVLQWAVLTRYARVRDSILSNCADRQPVYLEVVSFDRLMESTKDKGFKIRLLCGCSLDHLVEWMDSLREAYNRRAEALDFPRIDPRRSG